MTAEVEHHDVIVIGSGFGGSFVAHDLATRGIDVCVLERGRRWRPGDFPRRPDELFASVWDPLSSRYGLFDVRAFRSLTALVAAGVGGGSLIYANVMLKKPATWFSTPIGDRQSVDWPLTAEDLEPFYERAMEVMTPSPFLYPSSIAPRSSAFEWAATERGYKVIAPKLAITFSKQGEDLGLPIPSPDGDRRETCRLCGECILGCNFGAKNTLDLTILKNKHICVRTRVLVRSVAPISRAPRCFAVRYLDLAGREDAPSWEGREAVREMRCRVLVIAAGTFGSTELLLRSAASLPGISRRLGGGFSPNGDLLTFASRIGGRRQAHQFATAPTGMAVGPTITRAIEVDEGGVDGDHFYVQDAGLPSQLAWLLFGLPTRRLVGRVGRGIGRRVLDGAGRDRRTTIGGHLPRTLPRSRVARSFGLLGMGVDTADGRLTLREDQLQLSWTVRRSRRMLRRVEGVSDDLIQSLGGRTWPTTLTTLNRIITTHPVGGVPMGTSSATGVVDDHGEVFAWPGLFVTDGSAMPGAVGPNPSLTIAAFALRASERVVQRLGQKRA